MKNTLSDLGINFIFKYNYSIRFAATKEESRELPETIVNHFNARLSNELDIKVLFNFQNEFDQELLKII